MPNVSDQVRDERRRAVRELRTQNLPIRVIAAELGATRATISADCAALGLSGRLERPRKTKASPSPSPSPSPSTWRDRKASVREERLAEIEAQVAARELKIRRATTADFKKLDAARARRRYDGNTP